MKPGREVSVAWAAVTKQQERRIWANSCPKEIGGWGGTKELNFPLQTHVSLAFRGCLSQTLGFGYFPEIHRRIIFFFFFPLSLNHKQLRAGMGLHPRVALQGPCVARSPLAAAGAGMDLHSLETPLAAGRHWAFTVETQSPSCHSRV